jgi:hypothetical protein
MPSFEHTRSITMAAPPGAVHALVDDFHAWAKWSPWEGLDTDLTRTYGGSEKGGGARYAWAGKKSGEGSMSITSATPHRIDIDLNFVKPRARQAQGPRGGVSGRAALRVRQSTEHSRIPSA